MPPKLFSIVLRSPTWQTFASFHALGKPGVYEEKPGRRFTAPALGKIGVFPMVITRLSKIAMIAALAAYAFRIATVILVVLVFVSLPDDDPA